MSCDLFFNSGGVFNRSSEIKNGFEDNAHDAASMAMGEAVWQLMAGRQTVTVQAIAEMVLVLSDHRDDLAGNFALSVLLQA